MLEAATILDTVIALFKRFKSLFVIVPLVALLGLSHCSDKRHTRQRDEARVKLVQLEQASAANLAAQRAQIEALTAKMADNAKENVRVETQIRTVYRDRASSYADTHRIDVRDGVCRGTASAPGEGPVAPQPDSPGQDAVLVSRTDFDLFVENSARLEAAHRWAQSLIDDGTAEAIREGVKDLPKPMGN